VTLFLLWVVPDGTLTTSPTSRWFGLLP